MAEHPASDREGALLAVTAFPHAVLPNPLVREIGALAGQARLSLPLVQEGAADIFMGSFTTEWRAAATAASRLLDGSCMRGTTTCRRPPRGPAGRSPGAPGGGQADCRRLRRPLRCPGRETLRGSGDGSFVATNGTVLEQAQVLTTHNLAVLVEVLELESRLREFATEIADRALGWAVKRLGQPASHRHAELQAIKNAAYAWRQAIFFLSFQVPAGTAPASSP